MPKKVRHFYLQYGIELVLSFAAVIIPKFPLTNVELEMARLEWKVQIQNLHSIAPKKFTIDFIKKITSCNYVFKLSANLTAKRVH